MTGINIDKIGTSLRLHNMAMKSPALLITPIIGLALNVPLYQGGRVNSRIREAEHRYREALAILK